jgi:hypothetical protein
MPPTKKAPRIDKKATCIRFATTTVKLPRSLQINSDSFDAATLVSEMSGKYTALVNKIKELDGLDRRDHGTRFKHFIFTDMRDAGAGAKALAAFMVAGGFEFQMKHGPKYIMRKGERVATREGETALVVGEPVRHGNKGFAMLQSAPLWKNPLSVATKKEILRVFNSRPENVNGQLLRIMILDSKFKEGIDLFDVKYVHFIEPPLADADLKQALGRATRYCGQKGLRFIPNRGWPLQVFTYTTDIPARGPHFDNFNANVYQPRPASPSRPIIDTNGKWKVYTMIAHGMDLPSVRRKRMPKNCMYITLMECGKLSYVWSKFGELYSKTDTVFEGQTIRDILSNPLEQKTLLTKLFRSYGLPEPHIHYHDDGPETEDNTFIDAFYSPAMTWDNSKHLLGRSGLFEIGDYSLDGMEKINPTSKNYYYAKKIKNIGEISPMYEGSSLPKKTDVEAFIRDESIRNYDQFHKAMADTANPFAIRQSQLFARHPGIYYNPVCRSVGRQDREIARAIKSPERIQYVDAHKLVLKYSGIDLGFLQLTRRITEMAIESAVDARLNRNINTKISLQEGGVADIVKCLKRKSRRFPFTKPFMVRVAKRMGLQTPKRAKRDYYCHLLDTNKEYYAALLRGPSPKNTTRSLKRPLPVIPLGEPVKKAVKPVLLLEDRKETLAELARGSFVEFQEGIERMYAKHTWKRTVLENGCVSPDGAAAPKPLGNPITFNPTQEFIRHYLTPASPFKGLLAWHSVGTGKTCTAVATASSSFEQAGYQILWVTRNSLLSDVWKNIFGSVCSIPILEKLRAGATIPDDIVAQKKMLSRAWLPPVSYRVFQNALERKNELGRRLYGRNSRDPLHKTFLIIDEVHKLYDGDLLPTEAADFKTLQKYIHASYKTSNTDSVRVLLMSATPITESPDQLFGIVNTLRTDDYLPAFSAFRERFCTDDIISEEGQTFVKERMKGLISYLNREFDPTTFAQPEFHTVRVPIGEFEAPDVKDIADNCTTGLDEYKTCIRDTTEEEIRGLARNEMDAKNYRKAVSEIRKRYKTRKTACMKTFSRTMKNCYDQQKKTLTRRNTLSQMSALESCFGKPSRVTIPSFADLKKEMVRREALGAGRESIESTDAVRFALV